MEDAQKNARPRELSSPLPAIAVPESYRTAVIYSHRFSCVAVNTLMMRKIDVRIAMFCHAYLHINMMVCCLFSMLVLANLLRSEFLCGWTLEGREDKLLLKIVDCTRLYVKVECSIYDKPLLSNVFKKQIN